MEGFHFEVDQLYSIKVHLVVDVIYSSHVGGNLRNTCIYVRKQSKAYPVFDLVKQVVGGRQYTHHPQDQKQKRSQRMNPNQKFPSITKN